MNWISTPLRVDSGPAVVVRTEIVRTASQQPPALSNCPTVDARVIHRLEPPWYLWRKPQLQSMPGALDTQTLLVFEDVDTR